MGWPCIGPKMFKPLWFLNCPNYEGLDTLPGHSFVFLLFFCYVQGLYFYLSVCSSTSVLLILLNVVNKRILVAYLYFAISFLRALREAAWPFDLYGRPHVGESSAGSGSLLECTWLKPGFHYPSWRAVLTGARFVSTGRVDGPSKRRQLG